MPKKVKNTIEDSSISKDDFPLKFMEIILTTFFIATLIMLFIVLKERNYNILKFIAVNFPFFLPFFLPMYFYFVAYTHPDQFLNNKKFRNITYTASIFILLISITQMQEISFIFEETSMDKYFLNFEYAKNCFYHPLFNMALDFLFVYSFVAAYKGIKWWEGQIDRIPFVIGIASLGYFLGHFVCHFLIKLNLLSEVGNFNFTVSTIFILFTAITSLFLGRRGILPSHPFEENRKSQKPKKK